MREIPLTRGFVAIVDDEDYGRLSACKWNADVQRDGQIYARRLVYSIKDGARHARVLRMHVEIMEHLCLAVPGRYVDHRDGNGLNNRRSNLRIANNSLNIANAKKRRDAKSSKYKGVSMQRSRIRPWVASVRARTLGCFATEEEAARAYDAAARAEFGEFARLNFPDQEGA